MLKHEVHGRGEPLVLVHGLTHRRQAWYPVLEHLTDHREVVLFDLPGHGQSPDLMVRNGDVQASIREDLTAMLDALGLDRPHIAGNSLGGRVALEAAADDLVRSATTLSPAGFWHGRHDFVYIRSMFAMLTTGAAVTRPVMPVLSRSGAARELAGAMIFRHGSRIPAHMFRGDMRAMRRAVPAMRKIFPAAEPFTRPIGAHIPVTIAWGQHDHLLLPYQADVARRQLPDARHVWLEGCGHVPMSDDPAQVARVLLEGSAPVALQSSVA